MNVPELFPARTDEAHHSPMFMRFFVVAIALLFVATHAPVDFVMSWYDRFFHMLYGSGYLSIASLQFLIQRKHEILVMVIVPVQTLLFFSALAIVVYPILSDLRRSGVLLASRIHGTAFSYSVVLAFGALMLLVVPMQLGQMGNVYSLMSRAPFNYQDWQLWSYQRILMPALAYLLQFQGPVLYFLFSIIVTAVLFYLVHLFFRVRGIALTPLELISIGTSSFIITQFQSPGYPEQLMYIFILLLCIIPTGTVTRLSLFVLSLLSHEVSALPLLFIALFFFPRKQLAMMLAITALYGLFWIVSYGGDVERLLAVRNVNGMNGIAWAAEYPVRLLLGIAVSFKLLWVMIIRDFIMNPKMRMVHAGSILVALFVATVGVDTSRLMGFGFLSLLLSIASYRMEHSADSVIYRSIIIANILLPSFYIGTNIGNTAINGGYQLAEGITIVMFHGIYQLLYFGM
jgi:hypothetical protein